MSADDATITAAEAAAMLALDSRGQVVISPTERRKVEGERIALAAAMQAENAALRERVRDLQSQVDAMKLCTRCGAKYDATGTCSNKPCQGGTGEWCIEHHGAPFAYGIRAK